jgi:hypothetical protein
MSLLSNHPALSKQQIMAVLLSQGRKLLQRRVVIVLRLVVLARKLLSVSTRMPDLQPSVDEHQETKVTTISREEEMRNMM